MRLTAELLAAMTGAPVNDNMRSAVAGLARAGIGAGLNRPHRLAAYVAQTGHESASFHYDREVWGPSVAQKRYDTRTDLGNTAAADGDGFLYRGRGPIQITGKANYAAFTAWARRMDRAAPDFVAQPDAVNTDPWEGLVAIWYWDRNGLNTFADAGDFTTLTRRINGGTNGLADRQARYVRAALVLLGYGPRDVARFQTAAHLKADGVAGPLTRDALHRALTRAPLVEWPSAPTPSHPAALPSWLTWLNRIFGGK